MPEKKPLILVIDDEESMRDSCSLILTKDGYKTETAPDGESGLKKIKELQPDLILVDLKMPGISGFDVLEKVSEIDPNIVSVVITGYATVESAVEAMKKGAYDFLPKPFTPDELRIIIRRGLERRNLTLQKESLEKEKRAMEENFITMVTHQLKSPIAVILQYFEIIISDIVKDEQKKKEMLIKAKERLEGLLKLINDWLDVAKMNKGQIVEKMKPVHLTEIIENIIEFNQPFAEENKVSLRLLRPKAGDLAYGDPETLEQVFSNLINNAIKYNRPDGKVEVSIEEKNGFIAVSVKDTGIGMEQKHIPYLFEQFYRIKKEDGEKHRGTGLGLSIAKKIVDAHNGRIEVESKPGEGSCFTVFLPKTSSEQEKPS